MRRIILLMSFLSLTGTAVAQSAAQSNNPDKEDEGIQWSLGGGFVASPRPYIETDPQVIPIPVVGLRYKRWFVQGIRGGYDVLQKGDFTGSLFAQARFRGLEPDSSPFLEGMQPRKKSADGGAEFVYQGRPVGFRASFISDILGRSKGQEVSLLAVTGAPLGRVLVLLGAGPRWLSSNRIDYYYGVRNDEVRPGRPAYTGESTWNLDINLTVRVKLSEHWTLFSLVNREGFGSAIRNSPLVGQGAAYSLVTSVTYDF
jgi:outer membrane protein